MKENHQRLQVLYMQIGWEMEMKKALKVTNTEVGVTYN